MADLGFIGLGLMGRPMAGHLLAGGHQLFLHTRSGVPHEMIGAGGVACETPGEVARQADIVFIMVPDTPDVEKVLFGPNGVADELSPGKIIVDMSSISPLATREFARRIVAKGSDYLDAPVSGGDVGAKTATLTFMVGGSESGFARVKPFFALMGKTITRIGASGDGQTAKVANQIIVALTIAAVSEALLFASKAGADPAKVRQALLGGFASSRILELHGQRMLSHAFTPGFRTVLHHKDLGIGLASAQQLHMPLPQTALCQELFSAALAAGEGDLDDSALILVLERLAKHTLGA